MKYLLLLLFVQPIICHAQSDQLTFVGMLGFERVKKIVDPYYEGTLEYEFFMENFEVVCKWADKSIKEPISGRIAPKETYHDKYFQGKQVELRITVPAKAFNETTSFRDVLIIAYSKKNKKIKPQRIPAFTISTQLRFPNDNRVNSNTYKIEDIIGISSPEELSIPMVINYVTKRLYGVSDHKSNFLSTVVDLDRFYEKRSSVTFLQYDQLIKFYDLLHFIEPFVDENSFLNEEARKLNFKLSQISETLFSKKNSPKMNQGLENEYSLWIEEVSKIDIRLSQIYDTILSSRFALGMNENLKNEYESLYEEASKLKLRSFQIDSLVSRQSDEGMNVDLINEYNFGKNVYQDYQTFYIKLNGYYKQLQAILFLSTPSQIKGYRYNRFNPTHIDTIEIASFKFTLGTGVSYGLNKIYNITTTPPSDLSRVQFQDISRLNTILSAGLIWSPFSRKNIKYSDSIDNNQTAKYHISNFSLGFFVDYYLYPSQRQVSSNTPFGLGFGIGYSKNNFGVLGKIGFNTLRYPRQFFIDSFRNQNRPIGSYGSGVNINDNSLFFDKTNISLGISVVYNFSNLRRKDEEY